MLHYMLEYNLLISLWREFLSKNKFEHSYVISGMNYHQIRNKVEEYLID